MGQPDQISAQNKSLAFNGKKMLAVWALTSQLAGNPIAVWLQHLLSIHFYRNTRQCLKDKPMIQNLPKSLFN